MKKITRQTFRLWIKNQLCLKKTGLLCLCMSMLVSACINSQRPPDVLIQKQSEKTQPSEPSLSKPDPFDESELYHPEEILKPKPKEQQIPKAQTKIALLLPLSHSNKLVRSEAEAMLKAAELALFNEASQNILILIKDTEGKADSAANKAEESLSEGAKIILGPVLSQCVNAVSQRIEYKNAFMIALSSDRKKASGRQFMLGFPVEEDIRNLVHYLKSFEIENYAFLGPASSYGHRAYRALEEMLTRTPSQILGHFEYYEKNYPAIQATINQLDQFKTAHYQAILIPEYGDALRILLPSLVQKGYYRKIEQPVLFLGTSLWMDPKIIREPAMQGGLFAAPPQLAGESFHRAYFETYHQPAERLSGLAYDGVTLANYLVTSPEENWQDLLTSPIGFYGTSGLFRFKPDGHIERALAIYTVKNNEIVKQADAPERFDDTDS